MRGLNFIAAFAAVLSQGICSTEAAAPVWNDSRLNDFQDAWKSINQNESVLYYLVKTNYNNDSVWGTNFSCLSVQETQKNETAQSVVSMFRFMNGTSEDVYNVSELVQVVTTGNYSKANAITYYLNDNTTLTDSLIFTDGKTCDVFHVPYKNGGNGCELWVRKEYADKIPECCLFIFEAFCGPATYHNVYTQEKCGSQDHMQKTIADE